MKNLKRALSLVLSVAMLAGMMMVSTGAAFADVKAEHNEEAIAVVSAAGIMGANEEFNPDANITRNEMAVVMVNMLGLDTKDFAGASNFTDVPAWAAEYVDACYANGIVSGVSATQYNGSANVTTAEAALMMLKALGYYEKAKLNDWMLDTIKTASKIDLLDGIDAKATAKLTRNEVAQLCLNALESNTVEETAEGSNTSIKGEDIEITVDSSVDRDDELKTKYDYDETNKDEDYEQLIEKLFGKRFVKQTGSTKMGLPATEWFDKEQKKVSDQLIIAVADEADVVVVSEKAYTDKDGAKAYTDLVDEDYDAAVDYAVTLKAAAGAGDEIYFYENDDAKTITGYVVDYEMYKITDIDTEVRKADAEDGIKSYISILLNADDKNVAVVVNDKDFAGFDYEKNDYILAVVNAKDEVLASELAETVEGEVRSINKDGEWKIGGTYYESLIKGDMGSKATWFLNKAGQIANSKDLVDESSDYAVIYNIVKNDDADTEDGYVDAKGLSAYVVLADGTKAKYVIDKETVTNEKLAAGETFKVVAYSINEDNEFVIETEKDTISAMTKIDLNKDDAKVATGVYANSKTEFVFAKKDTDDNKMVVSVNTGVKNVSINDNAVTVYDDDGIALYVFVNEKATTETDAVYGVLLETGATKEYDDDDKVYYTYAVYGAEDDVLAVKSENKKFMDDLTQGAIFTYELKNGYATKLAVVSNAIEAEAAAIEFAGDDFVTIAGVGEKNVTEDTEVYTIVVDYKADDSTKIDTITVSKTGTLAKDAKVIVELSDDAKDIETAFIVKVRK